MVTHSGQILVVDRQLLKKLLFNEHCKLLNKERRRHALTKYLQGQISHIRTCRTATMWDIEHDLQVAVEEIEHDLDHKALREIETQCNNSELRMEAQIDVFANSIDTALKYLSKTLCSAHRGSPAGLTMGAAGETASSVARNPITELVEKKLLLLSILCISASTPAAT